MITSLGYILAKQIPLVRSFFEGPRLEYENADLTGKVVIVTGSNIGIGLETARNLACMGAKLYLGCRNSEKAKLAIEDIKASSGNNEVHFLKLDLSSFASVRNFVMEFESKEQTLDILVNNAGGGNPQFVITKDEFESTMQCNYLSTILLSYLLLPCLKRASSARVVNLSSELHYQANFDLKKLDKADESYQYSFLTAYPNSKLFLSMMTKEFAIKLQNTSITFLSIHPGIVNSNLWTKDYYNFTGVIRYPFLFIILLVGYLGDTTKDAAKTTTFAAVDHRANITGAYMEYFHQMKPHQAVNDEGLRAQLFDATFAALNIKPEF